MRSGTLGVVDLGEYSRGDKTRGEEDAVDMGEEAGVNRYCCSRGGRFAAVEVVAVRNPLRCWPCCLLLRADEGGVGDEGAECLSTDAAPPYDDEISEEALSNEDWVRAVG